MNRRVVIALGGNAISRRDEEGTIIQQFSRAAESMQLIAELVEEGWQPVLTHGNGPQVGKILHRVELASRDVYRLPLHICVADTQAGMGFMISECLENALRRRGIDRTVTTLITRVEVDADDPAFLNPTKPVGQYLPEERAKEIMRDYDWQVKPFGRGEYRRVVASPRPKCIVEIGMIRKLADAGELLVTCGGGGIPVERLEDGTSVGVDCVVDKDRTSALLAAEVGADTLVIATGVDRVYLDYLTESRRGLDRLTVKDAKVLLDSGVLEEGTIGPKVEAAVSFLESEGARDRRVLITRLEDVKRALAGEAGTLIQRRFE